MESAYDDSSGTIADLEADIEDALDALLELERRGRLPQELRALLALTPPEGASVHVSLRQRDTLRQIRRSATENHYAQANCGAWIVFELAPDEVHEGPPGEAREPNDVLDDFIRALDRAERDPHMSFVSLKYFRDQYLAKVGLVWARDFDLTRAVIQDATDQGLLELSKVPNPRQPEFPVTTIRLARVHERVRRVLGEGTTRPVRGANADTGAATSETSAAPGSRENGLRENGANEHGASAAAGAEPS